MHAWQCSMTKFIELLAAPQKYSGLQNVEQPDEAPGNLPAYILEECYACMLCSLDILPPPSRTGHRLLRLVHLLMHHDFLWSRQSSLPRQHIQKWIGLCIVPRNVCGIGEQGGKGTQGLGAGFVWPADGTSHRLASFSRDNRVLLSGWISKQGSAVRHEQRSSPAS